MICIISLSIYFWCITNNMGFSDGSGLRIHLPMKETQETPILFPRLGRSLEEEMATHSGILAWKITWTEEPGELQPMRSQSDTTEHASTQQIIQFTQYKYVKDVHFILTIWCIMANKIWAEKHFLVTNRFYFLPQLGIANKLIINLVLQKMLSLSNLFH